MPFEKVSSKTDSHTRLDELINRFEPRIRDSFIVAVNASKSNATIKELTELLEAGRIDEALAITESIPASVGTTVNLSFTQTGADTTRIVSTITAAPVFFDQTNQAAVDMMRANNARLVREFTASQREAVQETIVDGIRRGLNPVAQARNFRDSVGLTRKQVMSVNRFRGFLESGDRRALSRQLRDRRFDRTVVNAIEGRKPLTAKQIDTMVTRYRERFIKFRAETIGRTEALRAVHEANNNAFQQAIDSGAIDGQELIREWHVTSDTRLRDSHSLMSGQKRGFNEPFLSGNGNFLMFPGDSTAPANDTVQCRCSVTTRFKSAA